MRTLLLEPFGGLAGDMLLAALLDLEHPAFRLADLRAFVDQLLPGSVRLVESEVRRGALRGRHLAVESLEFEPAHRHLADLLARIEASPLSPSARARSEAVLRRLAEAEASVHGTSIEAVHFHEVGALDTLVDVCGSVFALERLEVERAYANPPYAGGGSVHCEHGEMPVPAPGTAAVMARRAWIAGIGGERLTPTGAALLVALFEPAPAPGSFQATAIGYGAGSRDPGEGPPNLTRVQLGELASVGSRGAGSAGREGGEGAPVTAVVSLLELNLDDATGEEIGFLLEALRAAGALAAWSAPIQMKKGRPGVLVSALCREADRVALERVAFEQSPTLGLRWSERTRTECARRMVEVELEGERVRVKQRLRPGGAPEPHDFSPEFDDLAALARTTGRSLRALEREAMVLAYERFADARD